MIRLISLEDLKKAHVKGHVRHEHSGKTVFVKEHDDKRVKGAEEQPKPKKKVIAYAFHKGDIVEREDGQRAKVVSFAPGGNLAVQKKDGSTSVWRTKGLVRVEKKPAQPDLFPGEAKLLKQNPEIMAKLSKVDQKAEPKKPSYEPGSLPKYSDMKKWDAAKGNGGQQAKLYGSEDHEPHYHKPYPPYPDVPKGHYAKWNAAKYEYEVKPKKQSAGGVIINEKGEILLRKPKGGFGGYAWTFPKGRVDEGESMEEAALREVYEETGVKAKIIKDIDKNFEGSVTNNKFYIMELQEDHGIPKDDKETSKVVWVVPENAHKLINQTSLEEGRKRDLAILDEVLDHLGKPKSPKEKIKVIGGLKDLKKKGA